MNGPLAKPTNLVDTKKGFNAIALYPSNLKDYVKISIAALVEQYWKEYIIG